MSDPDNTFNERLWIEACEAWNKISDLVGFDTRQIAWIQGYYAGARAYRPFAYTAATYRIVYPDGKELDFDIPNEPGNAMESVSDKFKELTGREFGLDTGDAGYKLLFVGYK